MSEQEVPPEKDQPSAALDQKPKDEVGWADAAAIGIGCLVLVIFFVSIVIVGYMRGQ